MATIPTSSAQTIVAQIAAGMSGRFTGFLNFAVGKVLRALAEAVSGVVLGLQSQILTVAKLTRLSTSYGPDADSFVADFPLITRFGATAATGQVTLGRYTALTTPLVIPVGATVKTASNLIFTVYADTTNAAYSLTLAGYVLPPQILSVNVPVIAAVAGSSGNVAAGAITLPNASLGGISTVNNASAFTNGSDGETDTAFKARFQLAILGRSGGTNYAIQSAVANVKNGMQCQILEAQDYSGTPDPGMVTVIVDDGSGDVSSDVIDACIQGIADNQVGARAAGIRVGVYPAVTAPVAIDMALLIATGYSRPAVEAAVENAVSLYIGSLGLGAGLSYFDVPDVARGVTGVTRVLPGYTLNGGTADIPGSPFTTLKLASTVLN